MVVQLFLVVAPASSQTVVHESTPRPTPSPGPGNRLSPFASPGPAGPIVDGISLALQPQIAPYRAGGPMYFVFHTINRTRSRASFRSRTDLRFDVARDGGRPIRHLRYGPHRFDAAGVYNRELDIPIGGSTASVSDLSETYDIVEPGIYRVRGILTPQASRAAIVSPWVTVTVLPKR